jgi:hypothetical protein
VHPKRASDERLALEVLSSAERAWGVLTGPLSLPAPDTNPASGKVDVFLEDNVDDVATAELAQRDVRSAIDRASALLRVAARSRPGCALDVAIARATARAILWRAAPALDEGTARAQTQYLAELVAPCASVPFEGGEEFQSHPERSIADTWPECDARMGELFDRGAALAYGWLDWKYGVQPGAFILGTWALAATQTPPGAARWNAEPDAFDVFRETFRGSESLLPTGSPDDFPLAVALARATLDTDAPEAAALGPLARARRDWMIDWPDRPRGLSFPAGVAPTGASVVEVRCAGAPSGARLRLEATWEEHARMRWAFVRLNTGGKPMSTVLVPSAPKATDAQMTLVDLDGVASVLVVGANVGSWDESFDPEDEVWEPHGWKIILAAE